MISEWKKRFRNGLGSMMALLLCALVLPSCVNPRRDAAVGVPPATVQEAARILTAELTRHGVRLRGVSAGASELYFETNQYGEPAPPSRDASEWIPSTLTYEEVESIGAVASDNRGWLITIEARGGRVRLWLDQRDSALRARAALLKLTNP